MGVSPSRAVCECAADECLLVGRCLAGEQAAWEEFFAARTPDLVRLVRYFLGRDGSDSQVVDELVARVWFELVANDARLLRRYDPGRSTSVGQYFAGIVCRVVRNHVRAEHNRRSRKLPRGSRNGIEYQHSGLEVGLLLNEFAETLNPKEAAFLEEYLLENKGREEDTGGEGGLSAANVRQRRRRLWVKLEQFLYPKNEGACSPAKSPENAGDK